MSSTGTSLDTALSRRGHTIRANRPGAAHLLALALLTSAIATTASLARLASPRHLRRGAVAHSAPGTSRMWEAHRVSARSPAAPNDRAAAMLSRQQSDTETPFVQITPSGTVHASSVSVLITYCDDSTLNASSRVITRDGSTWTLPYTLGTKRYCGAYASSSGTITLAPNASTTISAAISDNAGNRGSATVTDLSPENRSAA